MRNTTEIKNNKGETFYQSKGTVKSYSEEKGYGFIFSIDEPDSDIYVHVSNIITDNEKVLNVGDEVEFIYKKHDKGLRAYNVKKVM